MFVIIFQSWDLKMENLIQLNISYKFQAGIVLAEDQKSPSDLVYWCFVQSRTDAHSYPASFLIKISYRKSQTIYLHSVWETFH